MPLPLNGLSECIRWWPAVLCTSHTAAVWLIRLVDHHIVGHMGVHNHIHYMLSLAFRSSGGVLVQGVTLAEMWVTYGREWGHSQGLRDYAVLL